MPESAQEYYARILAAADHEGRLPVAVEEMPGWDIFPYEIDSLRLKPLQPLLATEPDRRGEDPAHCWCAEQAPQTEQPDDVPCWSNDRWVLRTVPSGLPIMAYLQPRAHHDLGDLPDDLAQEFGRLIVAMSAAVEALPSVGRAHLAKYGDGGAHLHLFVLGRPARAGQFRGSPLLDWEENLPKLPRQVAVENARFVVERLVAAVGGSSGAL